MVLCCNPMWNLQEESAVSIIINKRKSKVCASQKAAVLGQNKITGSWDYSSDTPFMWVPKTNYLYSFSASSILNPSSARDQFFVCLEFFPSDFVIETIRENAAMDSCLLKWIQSYTLLRIHISWISQNPLEIHSNFINFCLFSAIIWNVWKTLGETLCGTHIKEGTF